MGICRSRHPRFAALTHWGTEGALLSLNYRGSLTLFFFGFVPSNPLLPSLLLKDSGYATLFFVRKRVLPFSSSPLLLNNIGSLTLFFVGFVPNSPLLPPLLLNNRGFVTLFFLQKRVLLFSSSPPLSNISDSATSLFSCSRPLPCDHCCSTILLQVEFVPLPPLPPLFFAVAS